MKEPKRSPSLPSYTARKILIEKSISSIEKKYHPNGELKDKVISALEQQLELELKQQLKPIEEKEEIRTEPKKQPRFDYGDLSDSVKLKYLDLLFDKIRRNIGEEAKNYDDWAIIREAYEEQLNSHRDASKRPSAIVRLPSGILVSPPESASSYHSSYEIIS